MLAGNEYATSQSHLLEYHCGVGRFIGCLASSLTLIRQL